MPLKRRAAPRAEVMGWDGSKWVRLQVESAAYPYLAIGIWEAGSGPVRVAATGDGVGEFDKALSVRSSLHGYNEASFDRWRNNTNITVLPRAIRTASGSSADQTNYNAKGAIIWLHIYAVGGTFTAGEGLSIGVTGKDPVQGGHYYITPLIGPYTTTGNRQLLIYPGCTDIGGYLEGENDIPLPRVWRIYYTISGTDPSFDFSVGASYVV